MLFVVRQIHGSAWDRSQPLRKQRDWTAHAEFMDALEAEGFVLLGGPLHDGALLIVQAESEADVRSRLDADPWFVSGMFDEPEIEQWEVLIGTLPIPGGT